MEEYTDIAAKRVIDRTKAAMLDLSDPKTCLSLLRIDPKPAAGNAG